jgi:sorbitol-specific phosphotransferase system component IIC
MAGGEEFVDLSSRIVPNLLVLSLAIMLAWALFGKRY